MQALFDQWVKKIFFLDFRENPNLKDKEGNTAIVNAVQNGDFEAVKFAFNWNIVSEARNLEKFDFSGREFFSNYSLI